MDSFAELREATLRAQVECELPDFLAERLLAAASHPELYPDAGAEVRALLEMLPLYRYLWPDRLHRHGGQQWHSRGGNQAVGEKTASQKKK